MKFNLNCKVSVTMHASNPNTPQTVNYKGINDGSVETLPPGRFTVTKTALWCEPAII